MSLYIGSRGPVLLGVVYTLCILSTILPIDHWSVVILRESSLVRIDRLSQGIQCGSAGPMVTYYIIVIIVMLYICFMINCM